MRYILVALASLFAGCSEQLAGPTATSQRHDQNLAKRLVGLWRGPVLESEWGKIQVEYEFSEDDQVRAIFISHESETLERSDSGKHPYLIEGDAIPCDAIWKDPTRFKIQGEKLIFTSDEGEIEHRRVRLVSRESVAAVWTGQFEEEGVTLSLEIEFEHDGSFLRKFLGSSEEELIERSERGSWEISWDRVLMKGAGWPEVLHFHQDELVGPSPQEVRLRLRKKK